MLNKPFSLNASCINTLDTLEFRVGDKFHLSLEKAILSEPLSKVCVDNLARTLLEALTMAFAAGVSESDKKDQTPPEQKCDESRQIVNGNIHNQLTNIRPVFVGGSTSLLSHYSIVDNDGHDVGGLSMSEGGWVLFALLGTSGNRLNLSTELPTDDIFVFAREINRKGFVGVTPKYISPQK